MLNYKQIWHGIKLIRWLNKFNLTKIMHKMLSYKLYSKYPIGINFDMCIKSVKNMQSNGYIFKICSNVNDIE